MSAQEASREVVDGCRVLGGQEPGDPVWGHVSCRDPDGRGFWMKAGPLGFEEVTEADVILVGWTGQRLSGEHRVPIEHHIHGEILRARADVASVVHSHPPHAISLAASGTALRVFSNAAGPFAGGVPRFEGDDALIDSAELGAAVARCLGDARAGFLVGHGIVTVGTSVATAVTAAVLLERACHLQVMAAALGGVGTSLADPGDRYRHAQSDAYLMRSWDHMLRVVRAGRQDGGEAPRR
jgi:ribulose-5-phosphate 4-epimerase/fuculose-1-phosphate aldolase